MSYTGINLGNVKENNRSAILKLLNEQGAMSRKDLAERLGLTPATVTLICSDLISAGILCEQGAMKEGKRAGRKKILVGIDYTCRYVLSIRLEAMDTFITVSDLKGGSRTSLRRKTDISVPAEEFLCQVAQEGLGLLEQAEIPVEKLLGVGVSVPGAVDRVNGVSKSAYRIWNQPVRVKEILKKYLPCPVIVENNVKAFAQAELIYGSGRKHENILFLKWGSGVGSALVINNEIYEGRTSKEGEIGHIIVEKDGKLCRCGRRGCLETKASIRAMAERVSAQCRPDNMPALYELVNGDVSQIGSGNIEWWIQSGDAGMWRELNQVIELVARTVAFSITILAPDTVVLYGEMFAVPKVKDRFLACCSEYDPAYNSSYLCLSELSDQIDYIGALAIVVDELFLTAGGVKEY